MRLLPPPGAVAPFELLSYENAYNYRAGIQYAVTQRIMPPWPPDNSYRQLAHDRSLSQEEINLINAWVNQGAEQGNPALAPPIPSFAQIEFGTPDLVLQIPTYTVSSPIDAYRRFVVHNPSTEDKYMKLMEAIPGNRSIVHHILVYEDTTGTAVAMDAADPDGGYDAFAPDAPTGKLIGGWVPGQIPKPLPSGLGIKLTAGADLMIEIHYPAGTIGQQDSSKLNIYFTDSQAGVREVFIELAD